MKKNLGSVAVASITALAAAGALLVLAVPAAAQVAGGTTTVGVTVVESTQLATARLRASIEKSTG
jgi:hypothetical protein